MPNKVGKEIAKDVEKQKSKNKAITANDQGSYVDSSRNIAVCLDSKELSKALKNFETEESIRFVFEKFKNFIKTFVIRMGYVILEV